MDTTQKNREKAQSAPRKAGQEPVKVRPAAREAAPPVSAQQNNGAVRTAQEQRAAAGKPQPRKKQEAPARKAAPAPKKAAPKKTAAPRKTAAAKKAEREDVPNKKRAYGNSKPKKTPVTAVSDMLERSAQRKADRLARQGKSSRPKQPTPAVIYTQPAAFNRNRLLVQLVSVVAVVFALVMGLSVFFKVEHITVSGAQVYSEWAIKEASGLKEGDDSLLTFSRPRAGALIKANLPYVDTVRFGIKLPDTVNIIIEEDDVVYAIQDQNEAWWVMNSKGRVVQMSDRAKASNHTQVLGVTLYEPQLDERGVATEVVSTETYAEGEVIPVTVTGAQRLTAALQILQALEANGIVGEVASVDVSRMEDIILWYGSRYQVNLGDSSSLDYKIACMHDVILQMSEWQSGILDISFTIWPNQVGYTPFA